MDYVCDCSEGYVCPPCYETRWPKYVNAYEVTLGFGGREEGGWWFDCGDPLASIPCQNEGEVEAAKALLKERLEPVYAELPDRSSVASEAADLNVRVELSFASAYPRERPHYE